MKFAKTLKLGTSVVVLFVSLFFSFNTSGQMKIGDTGKQLDLALKSVDGKSYSVRDLVEENGVLVIFSCNTCPFVIGGGGFDGWEKDYREITRNAKEAGLGVVFVNSNEAKREDGDSFEDMKKQFNEQKYEAPYLYDEKHLLADALGAKTTPHIYIFDQNEILIYQGAIDNSWDKQAKKRENYLLDAISLIQKGKKVKKNNTSPKGCSIKRI